MRGFNLRTPFLAMNGEGDGDGLGLWLGRRRVDGRWTSAHVRQNSGLGGLRLAVVARWMCRSNHSLLHVQLTLHIAGARFRLHHPLGRHSVTLRASSARQSRIYSGRLCVADAARVSTAAGRRDCGAWSLILLLSSSAAHRLTTANRQPLAWLWTRQTRDSTVSRH